MFFSQLLRSSATAVRNFGARSALRAPPSLGPLAGGAASTSSSSAPSGFAPTISRRGLPTTPNPRRGTEGVHTEHGVDKTAMRDQELLSAVGSVSKPGGAVLRTGDEL